MLIISVRNNENNRRKRNTKKKPSKYRKEQGETEAIVKN